MKPIQLVIDEELLTQVDRRARERRVSRSAFIRDTLVEAFRRLRYQELAEQERLAYARKPVTVSERRAVRHMQREGDRAIARGGGRW